MNLTLQLLHDRKRIWGLAGVFRSMRLLAHGAFILLLLIWLWTHLRFSLPIERYIQGVLILLSIMSACSVGVMVNRLLRYRAACNHSRIFGRQVGGAMHDHNLDEAISIARRYKKSYIARVVGAGLESFQTAMPLLPDAEVIEAARRGSVRSAKVVHGEMTRGFNILATVASIAPFVGVFGTVLGIINSFRGVAGSKTSDMANTFGFLSEALVSTALSLLVAVPALWFYNYLSSRMETFDIEMENASLELVTYLIIQLGRRN